MAGDKKPNEMSGYVKAIDLATLLDLSKGRITQLTDEGVLRRYKTPAGERYRLVDSIQAYVHYLRDKVNQKADSPLDSKKAEIDIRLKAARAEKAEIELKELKGQVHRWEDVKAITNGYVYEVRSMLMSLPGRLAMELAPQMTPEEVSIKVRDEVYQLLENLMTYQYDPEVYAQRVRENEAIVSDDSEDDE